MKFLVKFTLLVSVAFTGAAISRAQEQVPAPQPAAPQNATQTPADAKAGAADRATTQEPKATIYFYRIKQFAGSALEPSVYCDERELARMDNGRYFGVKLDPGKHTCRMGDKQTGFEIDMKAGEEYYAKVSIEMGFWKGRGRLTLVQKEQGAFEIKKVKPLSAGKVKDRTMVVVYEGSDKGVDKKKEGGGR